MQLVNVLFHGDPCSIQNYGSLDSLEPSKFILEKDQSAFNSTIIAEIDKTMKKHADNLLHVLDGVSARLTQLESRTRHLEESVDDLKISVGDNHGNADGKMRQLANILREVCSLFTFLSSSNLMSGLHFIFMYIFSIDAVYLC